MPGPPPWPSYVRFHRVQTWKISCAILLLRYLPLPGSRTAKIEDNRDRSPRPSSGTVSARSAKPPKLARPRTTTERPITPPGWPAGCRAGLPDSKGAEQQSRCRTAKKRYEFPPLHSITSSARASRVAGTVRPSALAVCRLMTNSNLVDCKTGRSAGLAPLSILPV
jgi:hypothetical protein